MLSFIMTPVYKNRSREADNQSAKAAYEEGEKYKITDPEKALIWYNKAEARVLKYGSPLASKG